MPEDKKPSAATIAKIAAKALIPAVGPALAARDIVSKVALTRMAENLDPYNYSDEGTGKTAVQRFIEGVVLNKKEPSRMESEQYLKEGYGLKPGIAFRERVDLLQMLAGKKQKYNTIEQSKYKPSVGAEEGKQYVSSRGIEDEIIKDLKLDEKDIRSAKDVLDIIIPKASIDEKGKPMIGKGGVVTTVPGLGQATYGVKRDEKGRLYLSYGDVWDLNPGQGIYADKKQATGQTLEDLKNMAMQGIKSAGTNIINATATAPNVYGRIYFDPKTGKPIR